MMRRMMMRRRRMMGMMMSYEQKGGPHTLMLYCVKSKVCTPLGRFGSVSPPPI